MYLTLLFRGRRFLKRALAQNSPIYNQVMNLYSTLDTSVHDSAIIKKVELFQDMESKLDVINQFQAYDKLSIDNFMTVGIELTKFVFEIGDKSTHEIRVLYNPYNIHGVNASTFRVDFTTDVIVLYPGYFDKPRDVKLFILFHEIGHIFLKHNHYSVRKIRIPEIIEPIFRKLWISSGLEYQADKFAIYHGCRPETILGILENCDFQYSLTGVAKGVHDVIKRYEKLIKVVYRDSRKS